MINNMITCPKCEHEFEATEALVSKIEKETKKKYSEENANLQKALKDEQLKSKDIENKISDAVHQAKLDFSKEQIELKKAKFKLEEQIENQKLELEQKHKTEMSNLKKGIEKELTEKFIKDKESEIEQIKKDAVDDAMRKTHKKYENEIKQLQEESEAFKEKEKELYDKEKSLKEQKASIDNEMLKLKNQLEEKNFEFQNKLKRAELENETKLLEMKKQVIEDIEARSKEEAKKKLQEKDVVIKERDERLERLQTQLEAAQRQTQKKDNEAIGEAFENYVQEKIENKFPLDKVTAVPKGVNGVDIQIDIMANGVKRIGNILIECKYANNWNNKWIETANKNRRNANADMVIIVTKSLPSVIDKFGVLDNVFITDSINYLNILPVLRSKIEDISKIKLANENKHSKLEQLFNYLSSQDFGNLMEHAINSTSVMQKQLDKDRKDFQSSFKRRQAEIDHMRDVVIEFSSTIESKITTFEGYDTEVEDYSDIEYEEKKQKEIPHIPVSKKPKTIKKKKESLLQSDKDSEDSEEERVMQPDREISIGIFKKHFIKVGEDKYKDSKGDLYHLVKTDEKWVTISKIIKKHIENDK